MITSVRVAVDVKPGQIWQYRIPTEQFRIDETRYNKKHKEREARLIYVKENRPAAKEWYPISLIQKMREWTLVRENISVACPGCGQAFELRTDYLCSDCR